MSALVLVAILTLAPALQMETARRYANDIAVAADGDIDNLFGGDENGNDASLDWLWM